MLAAWHLPASRPRRAEASGCARSRGSGWHSPPARAGQAMRSRSPSSRSQAPSPSSGSQADHPFHDHSRDRSQRSSPPRDAPPAGQKTSGNVPRRKYSSRLSGQPASAIAPVDGWIATRSMCEGRGLAPMEIFRSDESGAQQGGVVSVQPAHLGHSNYIPHRHFSETIIGDFVALDQRSDLLLKVESRLRFLFGRLGMRQVLTPLPLSATDIPTS